MDLTTSPVAADYALTSFFSSDDSDCPPITHTVMITHAPVVLPTAQQSLNFQVVDVSGTYNLRLLPVDQAVHSFFIEAKTAGNQVAYKEFTFTVACGLLSQAITLATAGTETVTVDKN